MKKNMIKKEPNQTDIIADKMKSSLESTSKGLALFLDSLEKSGLHSSLPAYQQMMSVLIQQKNWANTNSRTEMQPLWNEIAKNSEQMYQIMNAYSSIMNNLRNLNADNLQKNNLKQTNIEKILEYLKKYSEFPISELSENLKLKKKEIKEELEPFVKKGKVERKGRGKTLCYRLKETNGNLTKTWDVNEYSLEDPKQPKLLRTLPAEHGAHHILFSPDNRYMFVQNNLLNLEGINAGTISVVDFKTGNLITTLDKFTEQGMMIESLDILVDNSQNLKVTTSGN